jgi:hypothetical protein
LPDEVEPDPEILTLSREVRERAKGLDLLSDFQEEFGSPDSQMPRGSSDLGAQALADQGVHRQATWRVEGTILLIVQERVDGSIRYVIAW